MWLIITLFVLEILLLIAFLPVKVTLKGYFCLERSSLMIDIKLFGLTVARLRAEKQDGKFVLKLGDKPIQPKRTQLARGLAQKLAKYVISGNLQVRANVLAVLGDADAMTCAVVSGVISTILCVIKAKTQVFSDFERERADAQFNVKSKICLIQLAEMLGE